MKVRDIQRSHEYRESVKKWGPPRTRHRVFIAGSSNDVPERDVNLNPVKCVKESVAIDTALLSLDREIEKKRKEHESLKSWVSERKSVRNALNNIGFTESWYNNKPNKTDSEVRVHDIMINRTQPKREQQNERRISVIPKVSNKPRVSAGHVGMLPFLESPLPLALAIIADYLQDNRIRLIDLYRKVDKNQDWLMTRDELKQSLKGTDIPLNDAHLDELILTLDIDNDDQLSYKELAMGIETYHRDRRWQRLKKMYDDIMEENENEDEEPSKSRRPSLPAGLLNLPRVDTREHTIDLAHVQRSRRLKKQQVKKEKQIKRRLNLRPKAEWITTLPAPTGEKKLLYIKSMNDESARCVDLLQEMGLDIPGDNIRRVLVPPNDNPVNLCAAYLNTNRGLLPHDHPICDQYRKAQGRKLKGLSPTNPVTHNPKFRIPPKDGETPLPRVASLDFKQRKFTARKERKQRQNTSPTPCWPQHLLDKMRLCMDDTGKSDGKVIHFREITK